MKVAQLRSSIACWMVVWFVLAVGPAGWAGESSDATVADANAVTAASVVAEIDKYVITRGELEKRVLESIRPDRDDETGDSTPVDVKAVLLEMIAENAMILEGRRLGYENDESIQRDVNHLRHRGLANLLLRAFLRDNLKVTDAEVDAKLKSDPKLDRQRATALVQQDKAKPLMEKYYAHLCGKLHLQKIRANFATVAKLQTRLLYQPKEPRNVPWIQNRQITEELTAEEKAIVLATFDGGQLTALDWFNALGDIVPTGRPKDLNTEAGVEKLLDRALQLPIYAAEARLRGLDKNANLVKAVAEREDLRLRYKVQGDQFSKVAEPNEAQTKQYFEDNKEAFADSPRVRIDTIWCEDLATAKEAKAAIDAGQEFEAAKKEYSLRKETQAFETSPGGEGMFWKDLWQAEAGNVIGPVKGFDRDRVRWRVVHILEKTPPKPREFSEQMHNTVKYRIMGQRRKRLMAEFHAELLDRFEHTIHEDRIQGIDPLDIP